MDGLLGREFSDAAEDPPVMGIVIKFEDELIRACMGIHKVDDKRDIRSSDLQGHRRKDIVQH